MWTRWPNRFKYFGRNSWLLGKLGLRFTCETISDLSAGTYFATITDGLDEISGNQTIQNLIRTSSIQKFLMITVI